MRTSMGLKKVPDSTIGKMVMIQSLFNKSVPYDPTKTREQRDQLMADSLRKGRLHPDLRVRDIMPEGQEFDVLID